VDSEYFRQRVLATFGPALERATPANVEQFVAAMHAEFARCGGESGVIAEDGAFVLAGDPPLSVEGNVKAFLLEQLAKDPVEAQQRLWVALLELWFAVIGCDEEERLAALFAGL
jgi:hypothetical protein